jgi:hypothetical protein
MDELVQQLSIAAQPVTASRVNSATELKRSIDRGYVLIKFINTQGGTELGIPLDDTVTDLSTADFEQGTGTVHLAGNLVLNYTKVRCIADVDVATLIGEGHLEVLE